MVEAGKKKPVAINNVKNKLLHVIMAMVRKGEKYNPDYDYHAAIEAAWKQSVKYIVKKRILFGI